MNKIDTSTLQPSTAMFAFHVVFNLDFVSEIPFNKAWNNGTGYFDYATTVQLESGKRVKSYDPETQRKLILVGTPLGTVVVFERYDEGAENHFRCNMPRAIPSYFSSSISAHSNLSAEALLVLLGNDLKSTPNIGELLEFLKEAFNS